MSILARTVTHDGIDLTVEALHDRFLKHMAGSVREIVKDKRGPSPTRAELVRAGRWIQHGAPVNLGHTAAWMGLLDALESAGLDAAERFEVVLAILESDRPGGRVPQPQVLAWVVSFVAYQGGRMLGFE